MNILKEEAPYLKGQFEIYFKKKHSLFQNHRHFEAILEHLQNLTMSGKFLRGSLFLKLTHKSEKAKKTRENNYSQNHTQTAMAIEMVHTALLIHDDIMDQSSHRRHFLTMHCYSANFLQKEFKNKKKTDLKNGESLAICMGDMAFFMANELLSESGGISAYLNQEWQKVCLGQMDDVYYGLKDFSENIPLENLLNIYRYKTAFYTFSAPLKSAGIALNESPEILEALHEIGESLGIIYQIVDDYLDLFGDQSSTGKILGQDIIKRKKTLYFFYLFQCLNGRSQKKLLSYSKQKKMRPQDIIWVQDNLKKQGILKKVDDILNFYEAKCRLKADYLETELKFFILELLDYIKLRKY